MQHVFKPALPTNTPEAQSTRMNRFAETLLPPPAGTKPDASVAQPTPAQVLVTVPPWTLPAGRRTKGNPMPMASPSPPSSEEGGSSPKAKLDNDA